MGVVLGRCSHYKKGWRAWRVVLFFAKSKEAPVCGRQEVAALSVRVQTLVHTFSVVLLATLEFSLYGNW